MTQFVLGFLFTPDTKQVVLVRKKRPQNLAGKLNGVGGQLGPGENPRTGVSREFFEATGVAIAEQDWRPVARLWGKGYTTAVATVPLSAWNFVIRRFKTIPASLPAGSINR